MLCISFSGGEQDCSFTWEIVEIEDPHYAGFFDESTKAITGEDVKTLAHEAKHVLCYLQYEQPDQCYQTTDTKDIMKQARNNHYEYHSSTQHEKPKHDIWRMM